MDRVLVVRTDRLGDVLLTTPVSTALRQAFPKVRISWLVRPYTAPLLEHTPDVDQILVDRRRIDAGRLRLSIKKENFDAAIVAYPRWRIVLGFVASGRSSCLGSAL